MKSNLDSLYKVDPKSQKEGVWFRITETTRFKLLRFNSNNPNVKAAHAIHMKPFARQMDLGTLSPEKEQEIMMKLFIQVSLKDWEGVVIDGKDTPFTPEAALELFQSLPDLFSTLIAEAQNFDNYKAEELTDLGNS